VVCGGFPRDGGCESWRLDAGGWEHGCFLVRLSDDRGAECGVLVVSHGEGECGCYMLTVGVFQVGC
jgi:hypothetical protein